MPFKRETASSRSCQRSEYAADRQCRFSWLKKDPLRVVSRTAPSHQASVWRHFLCRFEVDDEDNPCVETCWLHQAGSRRQQLQCVTRSDGDDFWQKTRAECSTDHVMSEVEWMKKWTCVAIVTAIRTRHNRPSAPVSQKSSSLGLCIDLIRAIPMRLMQINCPF